MRGRSALRESSSMHKRVPSKEHLSLLDREDNPGAWRIFPTFIFKLVLGTLYLVGVGMGAFGSN